MDEELRVLDKFTRSRTIKDLQGKIDEGKRAIERVDAQADAKRITADADRRSKLSVYDQETSRFNDIQDDPRYIRGPYAKDRIAVGRSRRAADPFGLRVSRVLRLLHNVTSAARV